MNRKLLIILAVAAVTITLLSPFLARCGNWRTINTWESNLGIFGLDRPLYLSIQEFNAYVDPLKLYTEHRLLVSDGGYAYILFLELAPDEDISKANVNWQANAVSITFPSGLSITIPKERIIEQTGK